MPVRPLSSSVLIWPDRNRVDQAVRQWAAQMASRRPEVLRIGYFGSYARGDWGVGSDVDLLIVVERAEASPERRAVGWDTSALPVPADVVVLTWAEWQDLLRRGGRFAQTVERETVWVYTRGER